MNIKLVLSLLLFVRPFSVSSQVLSVALSQYPNKQALIIAVHGIRKDTLGTILLDENGKGSLAFKSKQLQAGLVNLSIKDKAYLSFDFVLSPIESPTLICDMEFVYAQNTKILNSPENDCLNRWFDKVVQCKQKIGIIQELNKLYRPEDLFLEKLVNEKQILDNQLQKILDTINQSSLFAGKYMQFKMALEDKLANVLESSEQQAVAKKYFTQIDFDALYGSSMWYALINTCIEAYGKEGSYYETFGSDVVSNLKRIKNEQIYEDLIEAAISVTEQFAWNRDQETIVDFIVKDNRIKNPQGKLLKVIKSYNLSQGKKAPDLLITQRMGTKNKTIVLKTNQLNEKYSLLLFYQSDCGYCETAIEALKNNYKTIVDNAIKIISIAGDTDQETFIKSSSEFPWSDKYCDLEGMNGVNFINYSVIGTPSMFLLDSKGIIIEKIATVDQLLNWMKNKRFTKK